MTHRLLALLVAIAELSSAQASPVVSVIGTELVVTDDNGRSYRGPDLVGATLRVPSRGKAIDITITSVEKDDSSGVTPLFLYELVTKKLDGTTAALCRPDDTGMPRGFALPDGRGGFELACTASAIGKCVRWGYRPWDQTAKGPPLRALHAACVHMTRADYGGDGHPTASEGTSVYVCDRFGVNPCRKDAPLGFEAAWGESGATCVARPRVPANATLEELRRRYPKLKGRLGPRVCTERAAFSDSRALLINRSPMSARQ